MSAGVPFPDFSGITTRDPNIHFNIESYSFNIYYLTHAEKIQMNFFGTNLVLTKPTSNSPAAEPFICFTYNWKKSGVHIVVEIYDLIKNLKRQNINKKSIATQILYNFCNKIKAIHPTVIIWLGTIERNLYRSYTSKGFLPFTKPLKTLLPSGEPESLFSPLGITPGRHFWSFLFPDFEKETNTQKMVKKNSRTSPIIISSSALRELPNFVPIRVSINGSAINYIYNTLVLQNKAESSLIFGISSGKEGKLKDIDCTWEKTHFNASSKSLYVSWHEMPAEHPEEGEHVGLQIASSFGNTVISKMPFMITGHTHPLFFYRPVGGLTERGETNQLISPPSLQDCKLIISTRSPCHLVWAQECIYSLKFNHLLSNSDTNNLLEKLEAKHATNNLLLNSLLIRSAVFQTENPIILSEIDSILGMYGANRSTFTSLSLTKQIGIRIKLYTSIFNKLYIDDDTGYNILILTPHFYTKLSDDTVSGFEPDLGNIFVKDVHNFFFTGDIDLGTAFANTRFQTHYIPVSKKNLGHARNICLGENCGKKPSLSFKGDYYEATHYPGAAAGAGSTASAAAAVIYENNPGAAAGAGSAAVYENNDVIKLNIVESKIQFNLPYDTYINNGPLSQLQRKGGDLTYYIAEVMYKPATYTYIRDLSTRQQRELFSVKYEYISEIKASLIKITTINPRGSQETFIFNNDGMPIGHRGDSLDKFIITKTSAGGSRNKRKTYRRIIQNIKSKTKSKSKK